MKERIRICCRTLLVIAMFFAMLMGIKIHSSAKLEPQLVIGRKVIDMTRSHSAEEYGQSGWDFNYKTDTLTLQNFSYQGDSPGILYRNFNLNIVLKGNNTINNTCYAFEDEAAILGNRSLTIIGGGQNSLMLKGLSGIYIYSDVDVVKLSIVKNANVTAVALGNHGIYVKSSYEYSIQDALKIDSATVNAVSTGSTSLNPYEYPHGIFVDTGNIIIQNQAVVTASSDSGNGIGIDSGYMDITKNISAITFIGKESAIDGGVVTDCPGTGWSDMLGTKGEEPIYASYQTRSYNWLRKIVFGKDVSKVFTVSFNANGGAGNMAPAPVLQYSSYKLPVCTLVPPLGKTFDKWDLGPTGTVITINGNITLKALWKNLPSAANQQNASTVATGQPVKPVGTEINGSSGATYIVTSDDPANPTVSLKKISNKKAKKITVPAAVSADGATYAVTGIKAKAFSGCKKLKTLTIKSSSLTAAGLTKGAFKGVGNKVTIKVPKKMKKTYKKLFVKKGLSKKVKIK